ncbi:MAG: YtxH domain-containing protein [Deltaproteobacteria bacterium]|nr:YtxH domain-containing protein [Deltaproteobacteria bacterium]
MGLRRAEETSVLAEVVLPSIALFALGAVVGAGAALLFAPKSGRELRHDLGARANELKSTVRNALPKYNENGGEQAMGQQSETYERPEFG